MIFDCSLAGDAGSFVAVAMTKAAESSVSQHVDCFVVGDTEGFVFVGIRNSVAEGVVCSGAKGVGGAFLADFVDCHPNPLLCVLLYFWKWGNAVSMSIFQWLVWALSWHGGVAAVLVCCSVLMVGAGKGLE